jgi:hypothetical protein
MKKLDKKSIGHTFELDMGSSAPVKVKILELRHDGVYCEYLNSWANRKELLDYAFFES